MPPRKKPQQLDLVEAVNDLPPAGHNNPPSPIGSGAAGPPVSDNDLIAENFKLEDEVKAGTAKLNEWAKPKKERIAEIENEIQRRLIERGADSTRTDAGTAYISHLLNAKVEDNGSLFDWAADHWGEIGADVKLNIALAIVKNYMEQNAGNPPPGMSVSYYSRLNIKRS